MHELTRKTSKGFQWSSDCQKAFEELKKKLVCPPILAYPDFSLTFLLQADASESVIGAVLSQVQAGSEHAIAYLSRCLDKSERKYSTIEREPLAAVAALKDFYPYVYGFPCQLITDHNPLTSVKGLKDVGGRLSRWMVFLQQFVLEIVYKSGKKHANADALSRTIQGEDPSLVAAVHPFGNLELTCLAQNQDAELAE